MPCQCEKTKCLMESCSCRPNPCNKSCSCKGQVGLCLRKRPKKDEKSDKIARVKQNNPSLIKTTIVKHQKIIYETTDMKNMQKSYHEKIDHSIETNVACTSKSKSKSKNALGAKNSSIKKLKNK